MGVSSLKPHKQEVSGRWSEEEHLLGSTGNNPGMNSTNEGNFTGSSSNWDVPHKPTGRIRTQEYPG